MLSHWPNLLQHHQRHFIDTYPHLVPGRSNEFLEAGPSAAPAAAPPVFKNAARHTPHPASRPSPVTIHLPAQMTIPIHCRPTRHRQNQRRGRHLSTGSHRTPVIEPQNRQNRTRTSQQGRAQEEVETEREERCAIRGGKMATADEARRSHGRPHQVQAQPTMTTTATKTMHPSRGV